MEREREREKITPSNGEPNDEEFSRHGMCGENLGGKVFPHSEGWNRVRLPVSSLPEMPSEDAHFCLYAGGGLSGALAIMAADSSQEIIEK